MWRAVVTRPTDRTCEIQPLGDIDQAAGEFWATNPFAITENGENLSAYERNRLYLNVDGQRFFDASFASNVDIDSDSRSAIGADFDLDGDPDLLVANVGGGALRLFLNQMDRGNQFVKVELTGTKSNRAGVGSRLTFEVGDKKIIRDVFPANGCMGLGPVNALHGIGKAKKIDKLTIRWPTGKQTVLTDVDATKVIQVTEE